MLYGDDSLQLWLSSGSFFAQIPPMRVCLLIKIPLETQCCRFARRNPILFFAPPPGQPFRSVIPSSLTDDVAPEQVWKPARPHPDHLLHPNEEDGAMHCGLKTPCSATPARATHRVRWRSFSPRAEALNASPKGRWPPTLDRPSRPNAPLVDNTLPEETPW